MAVDLSTHSAGLLAAVAEIHNDKSDNDWCAACC